MPAHPGRRRREAGARAAHALRLAGEADFQLEQEFGSLAEFEQSLHSVSQSQQFRSWSEGFSHLLARSPKREILEVL